MSQTTSIKLFVSSRPNTELKTAFASYINVEILPEDVESDVQMFVRDNLEELLSGNEEEIDPGLLVMELATRAGGMFLWAVCQVQYLSRISTTITPDLIATLPPALESIFENVLMTLEDKDRKMTLRILQLVMFSFRPLDLAEIDEAIAISPSSKSLAGLLRLRQKDAILEMCGCMLSQSPRTKKIQLAHSSVYEFLTRKTAESSAIHDYFHFDDMTSHRELFATCVRYLSMNDFDSDTFRETFRLAQDGGHADSDLQAFAKAPFLDYAVSHLVSHMKKIELAIDSTDHDCTGLAERFFFEDSSRFTSSLLVRQYLDGTYRNPPGSNAYHIAAIYGIEQVFGLGPDQYGLKAQTLDGRNVLHLALENQQWEIVDAILRLGLGDLLSEFDKQGRSPLHVAVELGNTFMVQRLIEGGADPNLASSLNQGRTPIFIAVENKWDELTEYLSGRANLDICLDDGRSLHPVAAQSGSLEWITALEGSRGGSTMTPSPTNRRGTVRRDDNGWTPLHYAADLGHTAMIPKLMASGYAAYEVDKNGWTPLHAAIRRRFIKSATALLDRMVHVPPSDDSVSRLRTNRPGSSMTVPEPYDYYGLQTDTSSFTFSSPSASRPSSSGKYGAHFNPINEPTPAAASQPQPAYTYNSLRSQLTAPISGLLSAITGRAAQPPGGDPATSPLPRLNRISTSTEPAVSLQRNMPPGGGDDRFPSGSSTREALRHRALSPLYVAAADAYTEGVELLVKHRAKLPAWGLTEEEKAKCLKVALEKSNTPIVLPLLELFGEESLWDAAPQLIATRNDEIIGKMKARIPEETAYKVLIGRGLRTKQIDVETATSELLGTMVEKYVADHIRDTDQAAQDGKQSSLLTQALEGRHLRAATELIDRGADLHVRNREGETPLLSLPRVIPAYASEAYNTRYLDLADRMVIQGCDISMTDLKGHNLCHKAATQGNAKMMDWALKKGVAPTSRTVHARTPLALAVETGSADCVRTILDFLRTDDSAGATTLSTGLGRVVDLMDYGKMRTSPLLRASVDRPERKLSILALLVEADERAFSALDPSLQRDVEGLRASLYTEALCWTIDCRFPQGFELLLPRISTFAALCRRSIDGETVLHGAVRASDDDFLKALLQKVEALGEQDKITEVVNLHDTQKRTPLLLAVEARSLEKVAALLRAGARSDQAMIDSTTDPAIATILKRYCVEL
ncbi:Ankyrin-2 like protein [Verticillium longisporum]|nr:Ankyrin-2 like protein [Verticillium longisporum]